MSSARRLPLPGLVRGAASTHGASDGAVPWLDAWRGLRSRFALRRAATLPSALALRLQAAQPWAYTLDAAGMQSALGVAAGQLRRDGLGDDAAATALALVAEVMRRTLGQAPYDTQLLAAWLMLDGRLVEMATGEGKTLAAALAAGVAGLAGSTVHVLTANDYLVRRDRDALEPFYTALGLSCGCVVGAMDRDARAQAWRCDIVHATAREVTFDHLRDHLALGGERDALVLGARAVVAADGAAVPLQPLLPGLCLCLVDEADSVLLDEAVVPLILAAPGHALDADAYRRIFELSATLQRGRDYTLAQAQRSALLTDAGRARISAAVVGEEGVLWPPRRACELAQAALAARLLYRRDRDYALVDGAIQLIDGLSGRIADGRQWQGALQPMVQIKEGLEPGAPTAVAAQITYQRFFPRYQRLCGMSGTLHETRHELRVLYGAAVARVPLARPDRRRWLGQRCYVDAAHKWQAVLRAIAVQLQRGRPVLVGTDSVADSARLSALLHAHGMRHQLLNATQDADEAARIAHAGRSGAVTVATNIAGRGTDIRLDAAAAAAGGLHVIAAMRNRSRRIDRQLVGRAARHGDPGSAEALLALDDALLRQAWPAALLAVVARWARRRGDDPGRVPAALARPLFAIAQRRAEWRDQSQRRELRRADAQAGELYGFAGGTE